MENAKSNREPVPSDPQPCGLIDNINPGNAVTTKPLKPSNDILGYKLEHRLGSGGFGEVWAVEAPGGLKKALKIVYGFHDEKRALAELKSLDRVKSLRHPFLLSLERIEVYEGQLVVVSELADASLADLFNEYVSQGEPGIPRDEMLRYMSNAAEALDYLSEEKSLQHLDIKPENLLLVSGHVKVADFGLMKDLRVASQSMLQGMTPAYAAPELFDGKPATSSDQYSLAIMYCEMLSGVRPFPGTTPAQLAAQHIHGKPNLRAAPKGDQAALARALSKDPSVRYPSCVAFVEDLKKQKRTVRKALRRTEQRTIEKTDSKTQLFARTGAGRDNTEMLSSGGLPFQADSIEAAAPPECSAEQSLVRPTLIVTVGNTANRIGQKIKSKLNDQAGSREHVPSIRSVFIDSDRSSLAELGRNHPDAVSPLETIEVALQKPEDYRKNADVHLGWLSRRWIYNVPRTLQTEGLRPLGRLAFADHFNSICDSLEEAIDRMALPENLAKTADCLGMNPGDPTSPQVYLISSISGGIGSGMLLDLAYTIKLLLSEKGLQHDSVHGILLHSSYQRMRDPGLSAANSFAFLTEFRHFNELGYPGDQTLGIPEFEDEPPFAQTYFADLGEDLNQSDFEKQLESISEYVSLAATSKCAAFFDACRKNDLDREHFALRTIGLSTIAAGDHDYRHGSIDRLCHQVYRRWVGLCEIEQSETKALAAAMLDHFSLTREQIESRIKDQTSQLCDDGILNRTQETLIGETTGLVSRKMVDCLDQYYGKSQSHTDGDDISTPLGEAIDDFIANDPVAGNSELTQACMQQLNLESLSLGQVSGIVKELSRTLDSWLESLKKDHAAIEANQSKIIGTINQNCSLGRSPSAEEIEMYFSVRRHEFNKRCSIEYAQIVLNGLAPVRTVVSQLESNLEILRDKIHYKEAALEPDLGHERFDMEQLLQNQIEAQMDSMIEQTERQVFHSLIGPEGGFQAAISDPNTLRYSLPSELRLAAIKVLANVKQSLSIEKMIRENNIAPEQLISWLNAKINSAKPAVDDCGGEMRLLVGLPANSEPCQLPRLIEQQFQLTNRAIHGTNGKVVLCFEAEDVSLAAVAFRLLSKRPDAVELVKRIHARDDVDWTSLDNLL